MSRALSPTVGLLAWNVFQASFYHGLLALDPAYQLIINRRRRNRDEVQAMQRLVPAAQPRVVDSRALHALDGQYDVLVFQSPFPGIHRFEKTRLVSLQYGLAKEPHNYGAWRAFGDLALCMGPYSVDRIEPFCPAISVGNLSFETYTEQKDALKDACLGRLTPLVPGRKTVLYAPTWGDLSSLDLYAKAVAGLQDTCNLLVKLHHNTYLLEDGRLHAVQRIWPTVRQAQSCDLHALIDLADLVISDYSGAIFDALLHNKALVLLNTPKPLSSAKLDHNSIEWRHRSELGQVVQHPDELRSTVDRLLAASPVCNIPVSPWRERLFDAYSAPSRRAAEALESVARRGIELTPAHLSTRSALKARFHMTEHPFASLMKRINPLR